MNADESVVVISRQELATLLAALRFYQSEGMGEPANRSDDIHNIATDGDAEISLDGGGIDDLCEKLNCSDDNLTVWTMTADDENGLTTNVHLSESCAYVAFVAEWKQGSDRGANHSKVDRLLAEAFVSGDFEVLDDYLQENIGEGSVDSFQVVSHKVAIGK